jgi:hypothetical protein
MNIVMEPELEKLYGKLSQRNIEFREFANRTPGAFQSSGFKRMDLNDAMWRLQPWPTFMNRETKNEIRDAGVALFDLIKSIPRRVFNNDVSEIARYFGFPRHRVQDQLEGMTDQHYLSLVSRGDFLYSRSGRFKCLEYNVTSSLGGWYIPIWESLCLSTTVVSEFFREYRVKSGNENLFQLVLRHLVKALIHRQPSPGKNREMNMALVVPRYVRKHPDPTQVYLDNVYRQVLQGSGLTGNIFMVDYHHLKVEEQQKSVSFGGKKLFALIEFYMGEVPPAILRLYKSGDLHLTNGPISPLLSSKLMLAVLSDCDTFGGFDRTERDIIHRYIPWTRKILPGKTVYSGQSVQMEDFILAQRERLVIKTADGFGGTDVYVGKKTVPAVWREALETALKKENWLVQEYVETLPWYYQWGENGYKLHDLVLGFFYFGSEYGGGWVRIAPRIRGRVDKGVINVHQGAAISVIFDVEK